MWQSSPPGSIYDYIRVASFALGPDGRISQWSERAAELVGLTARQAIGRDPVEAFVPPEWRERGYRKVAEILDGREWTGLVPYRNPADDRETGLAEIYVMPSQDEEGERSALCIAVDVSALRRLETDLAASQAVFGQSPLGFFFCGTDLRMLRVNERFATVFGRPADAYRGMVPEDLLPRAEADRLSAAIRQVLATGQPVSDMPLVGDVPTNPERRRWAISLYRLHSGSGRPIGVAGLATDVTGRRRAELEAAGVRRNLALLNEAGARIGTSLDLETTARELLDVAVPQFCDLASVDLLQDLLTGDESQARVWGAHRTSPGGGCAELRRVAFASAISDGPVASFECCPPERSDRAGGTRTKPVQVGEVHRYAFDSACAGALRTAQVRLVSGGEGGELLGAVLQSTLIVPMVARDTVVGLVRFSRAKGSEPFGERDTALAVELAARAAVCIDNSRLYRREHERALILQRSLLPPGDPEAAGLDIACRYQPGHEATEVGGDWFDVIELPGHRTALVVGDVMGRGLRAAVAMGELRTAVRTLALLDLEPAEVLSALDEIARGLGTSGGAGGRGGRTVSRAQRVQRGQRAQAGAEGSADLSEVYLATCVYAVYDSVTGRCTFANAGHLPPMLVEPGKPAALMDVPPGMPLGVGGEPFEELEVELPEGALLALYTDGLVESRDHGLDEGLAAFREALSDSAPSAVSPGRPEGSLEDVCDHVLNTMDTHHGEDDIALLMARVQGLPAESVGDWWLPSEPRSVGRARELARRQLEEWGLDALVDTTELLVSELVTNALRYGEQGVPAAKRGGEIRLRLLRERTLVCEVWDGGLVQPRRRRARDTDEGGRGLQLVGLLSASWGSRRTPRGKTVWFELALPDGEASGPDSVEALLSMF
ncbi:PAS domain S-box protein [Streptomyces palmae]|uniref:PAS domain S-box protein n=2 Tax=Streptomyces palmae TaxID=1701085 RepID=A0A4Z0H7P1_9ACTN|nr:SpoIIE family protein phosphatase [Streptomyces palmae]TGB06854.1 PAS domain S-box protein [Streptomyces palmae]